MSENHASTTNPPLNGRAFIDQSVASSTDPVVLFSLSWCSFCRAAKQLLGQIDVKYRVIELDQGEFLEPTMQREVRTRLQELSHSNTLPQLIIAGEVIGGYTDIAAAYKNGSLAQVLERHQISSKLTPST